MTTINLQQDLGVLPAIPALAILGKKVAGGKILSAASQIVPNLLKNNAWNDIGGDLSQLNTASDQLLNQASNLNQSSDQVIRKLQHDIQRNQVAAQQGTSAGGGVANAGFNPWIIVALLAVGGGAYLAKQNGLI